MRIPSKIDKLKVKDYIRFLDAERSRMDALDKANKLLSIVTSKSLDYIENLDLSTLDYLYKKLAVLRASKPSMKVKKVIWVKGKRFRLVKSEKHLNANQFVTWETFNDDPIRNYNKLASVIYLRSPLLKKAKFTSDGFTENVELLMEAKVGQVFGALFFCRRKLEKLKNDSQLCTKEAEMMIAEHMKVIHKVLADSGVNMDGITSLTAQQAEILFSKMN